MKFAILSLALAASLGLAACDKKKDEVKVEGPAVVAPVDSSASAPVAPASAASDSK